MVSDTDAKVSVIIPVYNGEKYLDNCIKSVADQTYENLEIIIIDDGSTDRTIDICEEWKEKDDRVRVLHKPNGGRGSARNAGLSMATGDYIHFVDADDWIEKDAIESLYKAMIKNNSDIVIGNMTSYDQSEKMYIFFIDDNDYYKKIIHLKNGSKMNMFMIRCLDSYLSWLGLNFISVNCLKIFFTQKRTI